MTIKFFAILLFISLTITSVGQISLLKTNGNISLGTDDPQYELHVTTDDFVIEDNSGVEIFQLKQGHSIFMGENSGTRDDGTNNRNIGLGEFCLQDVKAGAQNIGLGLYSLNELNTGNFNIGIGPQAMRYKRRGDHNIAIGIPPLFRSSLSILSISQ